MERRILVTARRILSRSQIEPQSLQDRIVTDGKHTAIGHGIVGQNRGILEKCHHIGILDKQPGFLVRDGKRIGAYRIP